MKALLALLFVLTACSSTKKGSIPWKDGEFKEFAGTDKEVIHRKNDSVRWKITFVNPFGKKYEYDLVDANWFEVEQIDCYPTNEYRVVEGGDLYKKAVCRHRNAFKSIPLLSACHKDGSFTPVEKYQNRDKIQIYISCEGL